MSAFAAMRLNMLATVANAVTAVVLAVVAVVIRAFRYSSWRRFRSFCFSSTSRVDAARSRCASDSSLDRSAASCMVRFPAARSASYCRCILSTACVCFSSVSWERIRAFSAFSMSNMRVGIWVNDVWNDVIELVRASVL